MKLLTTAIFLIVSLVMMNSSFAQSDDILAAIKKQTTAIERQTATIEKQIRTMKVIAAINWGGNVTSNYQYIDAVVNNSVIDPIWLRDLEGE